MILSDKKILAEMEAGTIKIVPFNTDDLGSNSYDCHLGKTLGVYLRGLTLPVLKILLGEKPYNRKIMRKYLKRVNEQPLDAAMHNDVLLFSIPDEGLVLYKSVFYLGVTEEYTETHAHVPFIEGKSSTGRLSIDIHATAGKGDVGFCGNWTLEISVKQSVKVYKGMPIGQLIYFPVDGEVNTKYDVKKNAKYAGQGDLPKESMMWKNKFFQDHRVANNLEEEESTLNKKYQKIINYMRAQYGVYSGDMTMPLVFLPAVFLCPNSFSHASYDISSFFYTINFIAFIVYIKMFYSTKTTGFTESCKFRLGEYMI